MILSDPEIAETVAVDLQRHQGAENIPVTDLPEALPSGYSALWQHRPCAFHHLQTGSFSYLSYIFNMLPEITPNILSINTLNIKNAPLTPNKTNILQPSGTYTNISRI